MKLSILAATGENGVGASDNIENLYKLNGKLAGICYASESYFSDEIQNEEKALNRANFINNAGHHSVADHIYFTILIEDIPKILAMILNSTEFYTTSEKSARYTKMSLDKNSGEQKIYDKWVEKFKTIINETYAGKFTEIEVNKLAMENARYLTSVFTNTTMAYTTSFRQFNYLTKWLRNAAVLMENKKENNFYKKLHECVTELSDKISALLEIKFDDNKNRGFEFLPNLYDLNFRDWVVPDYFGDVYTHTYAASFASLAQLQRHRTIKYEMYFDGDMNNVHFYVPEILQDNDILRTEWLKDAAKLRKIFPQCTMVLVKEQSNVEKFILKCDERLCGRAQLETVNHTKDTLLKMDRSASRNNMSNTNNDKVHLFHDKDDESTIIPRCLTGRFNCKQPCKWGKNGIQRKI